MLIPKKTKYKKIQRGRLKGKASKNVTIFYGKFGLQAKEPCWLSSKQIEATRKLLMRYIKKVGKLWIKIFPDKPITIRSTESRMGSGKGSINYWVAVIRPNNILFEISDISSELAIKALLGASYKLPIKTKILIK